MTISAKETNASSFHFYKGNPVAITVIQATFAEQGKCSLFHLTLFCKEANSAAPGNRSKKEKVRASKQQTEIQSTAGIEVYSSLTGEIFPIKYPLICIVIFVRYYVK